MLEGLKGKAVDPEGHVTPQSLGKYVYEEMIRPDGERPKQIPFLKTDDSGDVILAHYDSLKSLKKIKDTDTIEPLNHGSDRKSPTKNGLFRSFFLRKRGEKYRLTIPILVAVVLSIAIFVVVLYPGPLPAKHYSLSNYWIYSTSNQSYNPKQSVNFPDSIAVDSAGDMYMWLKMETTKFKILMATVTISPNGERLVR